MKKTCFGITLSICRLWEVELRQSPTLSALLERFGNDRDFSPVLCLDTLIFRFKLNQPMSKA